MCWPLFGHAPPPYAVFAPLLPSPPLSEAPLCGVAPNTPNRPTWTPPPTHPPGAPPPKPLLDLPPNCPSLNPRSNAPPPPPPPRGLRPTVSWGGSWRPEPRGRPPPVVASPGTIPVVSGRGSHKGIPRVHPHPVKCGDARQDECLGPRVCLKHDRRAPCLTFSRPPPIPPPAPRQAPFKALSSPMRSCCA